jgi:hypothetical protein
VSCGIDMSEIHIFIIWEKAREKESEILLDIRKNFKILQTFEINWSEKEFERNLLRLYGNSLKNSLSKKNVCGNGSFLFIIIKDENPKYEKRNTLHGEDTVNVNVFDKKIEYRKIGGGGQRVHASNSEKESNRNIGLILNKSIKDFKEENMDIKQVHTDLVGSKKWDSLEQFFTILNQSLDYVVLRNFEELPGIYKKGFEGDIDILAEDKNEIELITNGYKISPKNFGRRFKILIKDEKIHLDLRYVGDGYLDEKWQKLILKEKVFKNKIFVPDEKNYFYSSLYHYLIQKKSISKINIKKIFELGKIIDNNIEFNKINDKESLRKVLEKFLLKENFSYTKPEDSSVFFDNSYVEQSKKIQNIKISKTEHKQTPSLIRLIQNSYFILKSEGVRSLFQAAKAKLRK